MAEIGAEPVSISELYSRNNKMFWIPAYQRSYAWGKSKETIFGAILKKV